MEVQREESNECPYKDRTREQLQTSISFDFGFKFEELKVGFRNSISNEKAKELERSQNFPITRESDGEVLSFSNQSPWLASPLTDSYLRITTPDILTCCHPLRRRDPKGPLPLLPLC